MAAWCCGSVLQLEAASWRCSASPPFLSAGPGRLRRVPRQKVRLERDAGNRRVGAVLCRQDHGEQNEQDLTGTAFVFLIELIKFIFNFLSLVNMLIEGRYFIR